MKPRNVQDEDCMTQTISEPTGQRHNRWTAARVGAYIGLVVGTAVVLIAAVMVAVATRSPRAGSGSTDTVRYLGVYEPGAPDSYTNINQFAQAVGRQPNLVSYYSAWYEPFNADFAASAAKHGAQTLVQIDARNISLASIASGRYDYYIRSYAAAVKAFGGPVILSFDHEMNGNWYPWGYTHASAADFVAAWRHIVTIFREQGARNVTWLWTVNIIDTLDDHVASPTPWWPGASYVNWVGVDGYYYSPSTTFAFLFGPTIAYLRELTRDPIIIAETGAARSADQPKKFADMFAGIRSFGLLGLVLFDENGVKTTQAWRIDSSAAYAALRQEAKEYMKPPK
jgi:hypothetical protein